MNGVINPPAAVQQAEETEEQLIVSARALVNNTNWDLGQYATKWTQRFARGRTDADFAELIGSTQQRVNECRRVYERFGDLYRSTGKFTHAVVALTADDPDAAMEWVTENDATVNELKAWLRMQRGDDLTTPGELPAGVEMAADQPHVGDVDPFQKPGTIVVPTNGKMRDDRHATGPRDVSAAGFAGSNAGAEGVGATAVLTGFSGSETDSGTAGGIGCSGRGRGDRESDGNSERCDLESVLDTVRSLIDALKPKLTDTEPQKLAAKLRRLADELDPQPEPEESTATPTKPSDESSSSAIVAAEWNNLNGVTPCRVVTSKRRTACRLRLKDQFFRDNWRTAMQKVQASDFCRGGGRDGWVADLDWFLRPDSVARIMEGKYDNREQPNKDSPHLDGLREWRETYGDDDVSEEVPF